MKKILFMCLFVLSGTMAFAQFANTKSTISSSSNGLEVNAGVNFSTYDISGIDSRVGFHLGVRKTFELPSVADGVYWNAGAMLSLKGCKDVNPYYLEIPVHFGYKYPVNDDFTVFGEVGPYLAIGLFGNTSSETSSDDEYYYGDDEYGFSYGNNYDDDYNNNNDSSDDFFKGNNRLDYGLGLRAGVEIKGKYTGAIGYDLGLANVPEVGSMKNRNFYVSFGIKF